MPYIDGGSAPRTAAVRRRRGEAVGARRSAPRVVAAWWRLTTNFSIFADFAGRYVAKMTGKSVFIGKNDRQKNGLFCPKKM